MPLQTIGAVIRQPGEIVLAPLVLDDLAPGELCVRTCYTLISPGTELAMFAGTHIGIPDPSNAFAKYPFAPGYAAVGEIVGTGHAVQDFRRGDCVYFHGRHQAVQILDPAHHVVLPVPPDLAPAHAPFARLAQIANTALIAAGPAEHDAAAVIGLGLVGNFAAQLLQRAGTAVHALDALEARCLWAVACGIERAARVQGDVAAAVAKVAGGRVPLVIEATGNGAMAEACLRAVAERGTVVLLGSPRQRVTLDLYTLVHRPGVRLVGAHERLLPPLAPSGRDQRAVARDMLDAIAAGHLAVAPLLSATLPPTGLAAAYAQLDAHKEEVIGILIDWQAL